MLGPILAGQSPVDFNVILMGLLMAALLFFLFKMFMPSSKPQESEVVTVLECAKCRLKEIRVFKRGDYVFKEEGPCKRCGGTMVITKIFARSKGKVRL